MEKFRCRICADCRGYGQHGCYSFYQAVAAVFIANASGICPGIGEQVIIVVMTLLAFTGTAGVPGEGLFTSAIE